MAMGGAWAGWARLKPLHGTKHGDGKGMGGWAGLKPLHGTKHGDGSGVGGMGEAKASTQNQGGGGWIAK